MPITDQQAIQSISSPKNLKALKRASEDNDRQRFHTGPATDEKDAGPYVAKLKAHVKDILNNQEKFERFCSLLKYPLPSSRLIDKAADEYLKAFGAEDRFVNYQFSSDNLEADASQFLDRIKFDDWLTKNLFNQCLRASAAVWIVDLPAQPNLTGFAEPFVTLRETKEITDIYTDLRGNVTAVIYQISSIKDATGQEIAKRWAALDDESFRVLIQRNGQNSAEVQFTNFHELKRCPAGWIWHDRLNEKEPIRIQSPLHAIFSDLDDLVIGKIFSQHADLGAAFPIFWNYRSRCTYETMAGDPCRSGKVTIREKDENEREYLVERDCPVCSKRKPVGPGSIIDVPQPKGGPDSPNLAEPAGYINSEVTLLEYNVTKVEKIGKDIREALTGDSNDVDQTKDAVNADQVAARFEARKAILSYWASHLQQTHAECLSVMFALRYGPSFLGLAVDYGTEFHLLNPAQAIADYQAARAANLPMYQLQIRRRRIDKLLAGANEAQMSRLDLLAELEPYPDLPLNLIPAGSDAWELKSNFGQYIARFERENISLEIFGRGISDAERISNILTVLYSYVQDSADRRKLPEPAKPAIGV